MCRTHPDTTLLFSRPLNSRSMRLCELLPRGTPSSPHSDLQSWEHWDFSRVFGPLWITSRIRSFTRHTEQRRSFHENCSCLVHSLLIKAERSWCRESPFDCTESIPTANGTELLSRSFAFGLRLPFLGLVVHRILPCEVPASGRCNWEDAKDHNSVLFHNCSYEIQKT